MEKVKQQITPVLKQHGVVRAGVFGSFARGDIKRGSDLDLLVELPEGKSLLDLVDLKLALEKELGRKTDVITYRSLHSRIKERVLKEQVKIL